MTVFSARTRPSPRHTSHGSSTTTPSPAQVGHGETLTNWPNMLRAARRTSPLPPQVEQVDGLVPGLAPLPSHVAQRSGALSSHGLLDARRHLGERELDRDPHVLAPARVRPRPPAAEQRLEAADAAEVAHEDVERLGQIHVVEPEAAAGAAEPGLAVAVVGRALLRIPEDLVRLGDLLELVLRLGRGIPVRVVLHGQLPIGLLDVGLGRVARDAEQGVELAHSSRSSTRRLVAIRELSRRHNMAIWLRSRLILTHLAPPERPGGAGRADTGHAPSRSAAASITSVLFCNRRPALGRSS